jgi:hypothetical protein
MIRDSCRGIKNLTKSPDRATNLKKRWLSVPKLGNIARSSKIH